MSDGGGDRQDNRRDSTHALYGADLATLWRVWRKAGGLAPGQRLRLAGAFGAAAGRLPFTLAEAAYTAARRSAVADAPPPVFILGHWRSGTTHLYNILSRDPRFGYVTPLATGIPWDFLLLGAALRPLLEKLMPQERLIDRVPVTPDAPQEDEIALASMQTLSFYHGLYFPRRLDQWFDRGVFFDGASPRELARWRRRLRYFVDKLELSQAGRRLLIKNPVYTARVAVLHKMWPDARFVHIHRNPYVVFQSTRNFYHKLLPQFALQRYDPAVVDELVLSRYPRLMHALIHDLAQAPHGRAVEIGFDELERQPLAVLERLYATLGLEGFEGARPLFADYLDHVGGYQKNRFAFPAADNALVGERWGHFIERWGYQPPGDAA